MPQFCRVPARYWEKLSNQRDFLDNLANRLLITERAGWYFVDTKTIIQHGGLTLLNQYNGSVSQLLSSVYREYLNQVLCVKIIFLL